MLYYVEPLKFFRAQENGPQEPRLQSVLGPLFQNRYDSLLAVEWIESTCIVYRCRCPQATRVGSVMKIITLRDVVIPS